MKKMHPSGPAFPLTVVNESDARTGAPINCDVFTGMDLRDFFAAAALPALLTELYANSVRQGVAYEGSILVAASEAAFETADAMLVFRKGGEA